MQEFQLAEQAGELGHHGVNVRRTFSAVASGGAELQFRRLQTCVGLFWGWRFLVYFAIIKAKTLEAVMAKHDVGNVVRGE